MKFIDKFVSFVLVLMATLTVACSGGTQSPTSPTSPSPSPVASQPTPPAVPPTTTPPPATARVFEYTRMPFPAEKLEIGQVIQADAFLRYSDGSEVKVSGEVVEGVEWVNRSPLTITLTQTGLITVIGPGEARYEVRYNSGTPNTIPPPQFIPVTPLGAETVKIVLVSHTKGELAYTQQGGNIELSVHITWGAFTRGIFTDEIGRLVYPDTYFTVTGTKDNQGHKHTAGQHRLSCAGKTNETTRLCSQPAGSVRIFLPVSNTAAQEGVTSFDGIVAWKSTNHIDITSRGTFVTGDELNRAKVTASHNVPVDLRFFHPQRSSRTADNIIAQVLSMREPGHSSVSGNRSYVTLRDAT